MRQPKNVPKGANTMGFLMKDLHMAVSRLKTKKKVAVPRASAEEIRRAFEAEIDEQIADLMLTYGVTPDEMSPACWKWAKGIVREKLAPAEGWGNAKVERVNQPAQEREQAAVDEGDLPSADIGKAKTADKRIEELCLLLQRIQSMAAGAVLKEGVRLMLAGADYKQAYFSYAELLGCLKEKRELLLMQGQLPTPQQLTELYEQARQMVPDRGAGSFYTEYMELIGTPFNKYLKARKKGAKGRAEARSQLKVISGNIRKQASYLVALDFNLVPAIFEASVDSAHQRARDTFEIYYRESETELDGGVMRELEKARKKIPPLGDSRAFPDEASIL